MQPGSSDKLNHNAVFPDFNMILSVYFKQGIGAGVRKWRRILAMFCMVST
jgi:hypothetical protein